MRNFGEHHRQLRFKIVNGLCTDEEAVKSLMDYRDYSRETAEKCLRGIKSGIEKDHKLKKEKDMRTKGNRAKKNVELTVEQIVNNYNERGRLLKGEIETLFALAERPKILESRVHEADEATTLSPLDAYLYPKDEIFENFDNEQVVTLGVGIGTWMLMLLDKNLPPHSLLARKDRVGEVQRAIMQLAHGLGKPLSEEALNYWCSVWNLTWNMAMDKIKKDHGVKDGED